MDMGFFYDYDFTLTEEIQTFPIFRKYMKNLSAVYGISKPEEYWKLCEGTDMGIGYMEQIVLDAKGVFCDLTNKKMEQEFAKEVKLAEGLFNWFTRMNKFVLKLGSGNKLEHHVISVGLLPLIRGSSVSSYVNSITAGEFLEKDGRIYKIKSIIDPFRKIESFKRICKGTNLHEDISIDKYHIKYRNAFTFGDGLSDIDLFRYARQRGAIVIAVFEPGNRKDFKKIKKLTKINNPEESFVNLIVPRDYSKNSILNEVIQQKIYEMVEAEKHCDMTFELIHNWKLNHIENKGICSIVRKHFENCKYCQSKFYPAVYFS